jgi:hypothetical protein
MILIASLAPSLFSGTLTLFNLSRLHGGSLTAQPHAHRGARLFLAQDSIISICVTGCPARSRCAGCMPVRDVAALINLSSGRC